MYILSSSGDRRFGAILIYMSPTITAIRAIGAEFAARLFLPVVITCAVLSVVLIVSVFWLATLSQWWLLLLVPVMILVSVMIGVLGISWLVVRSVRPPQAKQQRRAVKAFVDKLQRVSDAVQTPKVVLLFRIIRDIAAPRKDGFIGSMTDDTTSLQRDFLQLQKLFR